jgi:penicillin-binding protein 1C
VDGVTALRQAGSTLKPFLYELALEKKYLTAASILDDSPLDIATPSGLYVPQNYDKDFKGEVSVRTSLASSLNVPAVRTLLLLGLDDFYQRLQEVGFTSLTESADYYGYSLALGSAEVSLLELTNAYRALAKQGLFSPTHLLSAPLKVGVTENGATVAPAALGGNPVAFSTDKATPPSSKPKPRERRHLNDAAKLNHSAASTPRVMDPKASYLIQTILSDKTARSLTFGLNNQLATPFWTAVKTGTSKDMRDNWCIGFSEKYTVGVWVGNFDGQPMWDVSGVTGAAPIWRDVMDYLHANTPSRAPKMPSGVVAQTIHYQPSIEADRTEWFIQGTQSATITLLDQSNRPPKIRYPNPGSILAIDPDIPEQNQRIFFQAQAGRGLVWRLDGQLLGAADQPYSWMPVLGDHQLELVDQAGEAVDLIWFQVRGAHVSHLNSN